MPNELTNLLPPSRQDALVREYFFRLGVVAALLLSALAVVATILLLPTYIFLSDNAKAKEMRLANIQSTLISAEEEGLSARLTALSNDVAALTAFTDAPSASAIIRAALALSRPGITLSGLTYAPSSDKAASTLAISGIAKTRDTLRQYQITLQGASFARAADLPVSAYAKDVDIPFTITVTLAL